MATTAREREMRRYLKQVTDAARLHIAMLDRLMCGIQNVEQASAIANLANHLEIATDVARRFGLNESFKAAKKHKDEVQELIAKPVTA